jgi:hypothetical protein
MTERMNGKPVVTVQAKSVLNLDSGFLHRTPTRRLRHRVALETLHTYRREHAGLPTGQDLTHCAGSGNGGIYAGHVDRDNPDPVRTLIDQGIHIDRIKHLDRLHPTLSTLDRNGGCFWWVWDHCVCEACESGQRSHETNLGDSPSGCTPQEIRTTASEHDNQQRQHGHPHGGRCRTERSGSHAAGETRLCNRSEWRTQRGQSHDDMTQYAKFHGVEPSLHAKRGCSAPWFNLSITKAGRLTSGQRREGQKSPDEAGGRR